MGLASGRSQPWTSEHNKWGATGAIPPRLLFARSSFARMAWPVNSLHTETLAIDPMMALLFGGFA